MTALALRVALVDDDPDFSRLLARQLAAGAGVDVETEAFASGPAFIEALDGGAAFDLALLDVVMPEMGGLDVLRHVQLREPEMPVVMVSAQSAVRVALDALDGGAHDYLVKGEDALDRVPVLARQIAERKALLTEVQSLRQRLGARAEAPGIVGQSPPIARMLTLMNQALRADLPVAILGESGSGKELVARAIHAGSPRADRPFVVLNCGAIPAELMESELFGHEKGSFTGAHSRHAGVFEQADGGTLFLDEIGELAPPLQVKLLRVLQDQTVRRVGGRAPFQVDVRIISATHRDLRAMVDEGSFREDLFYRLVQFVIPVPPLRDRGMDVVLIAEHLLAALRERYPDLGRKRLTASARRALLRYEWPGNVRELKSAIERAALVTDAETIGAGDLLLGRALLGTARTPRERAMTGTSIEEIATFEELKAFALEHALDVCEGHVEKTADALGITRSTVYRLAKKYEIDL
ncbi:MAG TPA: sigma-54-dependent Fis family transcriptional regulator [Bacteroidetes bacterium]|nr:sigma-54-dependent Fis family transcriptional regulator [Bacteroidota bacterium]HIL57984.1 sigma-54-dependent Fis family transcriptional regulator [Rhodothermales bacterium]